nr:GIY-YIG nuclease family protein [Candidatus Woesebacteria bacterium]
FRRYHQDLKLKQLCTVRLSRALYPEHRHHNLDAIVSRFGFEVQHRHRAFDDAEVLWKLFQAIEMQHPSEKVQSTLKRLIQTPSVPSKLPLAAIEMLHEGPGVYIFYGETDLPIYIGKSKNVRKRVLSHFSSDHTSSKEMDISKQIKRIEIIKTAGELGALLKESELIKKLKPVYNHMLRKNQTRTILRKTTNKDGYSCVEIDRVKQIAPTESSEILGIYHTKKQAKEVLQEQAEKYHLCQKLLGIESGTGPCFGYKIESCLGACIGSEKPLRYNIRFIEAFGNRIIKKWPFDGPIQIHEEDPIEGLTQDFVIDNWCHANGESQIFEYDMYKILVKYLFSKHANPSIHILKHE